MFADSNLFYLQTYCDEFCESMDMFGKICSGLSHVCSVLGHEHHMSSAIPSASNIMTAPLTHTIAISLTHSGVLISASAGSMGSVSGSFGPASAGSVGAVSGSFGPPSAGTIGSVSGSLGPASAGSIGSMSGSFGPASAGSIGSVSGSFGPASAGSIGSVSGSFGPASAGSMGSVSGSFGPFSASFMGSVSGSIGPASPGVMSMTWPSIVTSAFGSMIATISPSAHSHVPMSSPPGRGSPWWSSYNISQTMERWLNHIRNNSHCRPGEKYCGLNLQCIPEDQPCTIHLSNDMMHNLSNTAWCVNCSSDQYFCPLFMQCIHVNESCSYQKVHHWLNSVNASDKLLDLSCGINETFCFTSMTCKSKGPLQDSGKNDSKHECRHNEVFCPYSASCRNKTDCAPFPALDYSKALENDTFGWAHMCQIKNLVCPKVARAMMKCERDKHSCNSSCPKGEKLCNDHHCIPVNETCCPVGQYFCNNSGQCSPNGTVCCPEGEKLCNGHHCIPVNETCCPVGQYFCNNSGQCSPNGTVCCPEGEKLCNGHHCIPVNETCCPVGQYFCNNSGQCSPNGTVCCPEGEKLCNGHHCIPVNETCCPVGQYFCNNSGQCSPNGTVCCPEGEKLCNGHHCIPVNETCCPVGQYFCNNSGQCSPNGTVCCPKGERPCNGHQCIPVNETCCPVGQYFCNKSEECSPNGTVCCPKGERPCNGHQCIPVNETCCPVGQYFCNKSGECSPNGTVCCPKGERPCNGHQCIPVNETCCPVGQYFCNKSEKCSPNGTVCCHEGEKPCNGHHCISVNETCCPVGQYFCNNSGQCSPNGTVCCPKGEEHCNYTDACSAREECFPPVVNATFPTVWKFLPLGSNLSKGIFEDGDVAVALRSVEMHGVDGSLEIYKNSAWTTVQSLSASNALVLGPSDYLRFVSSKRGSHGIVLVNFTSYSGAAKIGQYVDASSLAWKYGQTIAIFELPLLTTPKVVYNGSIYTVAEDSTGDVYFDLWDQFYDSSPDVDSGSHIPESVLGDVNPKMVELYNDLLENVDTRKFGIQIKDTSEKIKFRGGSKENYFDNQTQLQFIPRKNFHGNVSYSLEGFVATKNKSYMAIAFFYSPEVVQVLKTVLKGDELKLVKKVLFQNIKGNLKPTEENLFAAAQKLDPPLSRNDAQTVVNDAKKILEMIKAPDWNIDPFAHIDPKRKRVDMRGGEVKFIGDVTKIRILVTPVNDKPVVKRVRADLEPVPYDLNVSSYSGTLVKDVFDQSKANALVEDIDDRNMYLGVAVLAAENGTLGQWQYQMNDSMAFTDFSFTKDAQIMLLPPEATIKLNLHNQDTIWGSSDAFKKGAFVKVKAWDMSDNRQPGVYDTSIQESSTSISVKFANLLLLRMGCDNKTNFPARNDRCGVCRGKNKCVKCDDQPNSGATINKCGVCVGGTTGLNEDIQD
ncbi:hypothetical protein ACROYT_G011080 [Oculina patagonica]